MPSPSRSNACMKLLARSFTASGVTFSEARLCSMSSSTSSDRIQQSWRGKYRAAAGASDPNEAAGAVVEARGFQSCCCYFCYISEGVMQRRGKGLSSPMLMSPSQSLSMDLKTLSISFLLKDWIFRA